MRKRSVTPRCPAARSRIPGPGVIDPHELEAAAAQVEHCAVFESRRVDRRQVAVAGLLLAGQHPDVEARDLARPRQELRAVRRVADCARRHRLDVVGPQAGGPAEVGVHVDRFQRALHALGLQRSVIAHSRPDAHRFVDLVGPAPPLPGHGSEDHEPERVDPRSMTAVRRLDTSGRSDRDSTITTACLTSPWGPGCRLPDRGRGGTRRHGGRLPGYPSSPSSARWD